MTGGAVVWLTGLPSSGKSTLARGIRARLTELGVASCILDGDEVRRALMPPPSYDATGRDHFYATLANLAALLASQELVVLVAATAHRREYRERARAKVQRFYEVWVDVSLEECRRRDTKGLYEGFASGRARDVPGEDAPYEPPPKPDVVATGGADENARAAVVRLLTQGDER